MSQTENKRAKPASRMELVLDYVKQGISGGKFRAGDQLPNELVIAEEVGVSRTPVREAFKVLSAIGLVDVRHGQGTFVASNTGSSLAQLMLFQVYLQDSTPQKLMEVRLIFERSCAELAATRRDEEDLAAMQAAIEELRHYAAISPIDLDNATNADLKFHRALYKAAKNELIETLANFVLDMVSDWVRKAHEQGEQADSIRLHEMMISFIKDRNSGGARECYGVDANMAHFKRMLEMHA